MIYLNGEFMPLEQARVPVLDRGFIFGDGVYEMIPVYSRHPFRLRDHFQRLQHSLDAIRLANPYSGDRWTALIREMIARNPGDDQHVYLHITRGVAKRDHAFPADTAPTVFMMSNPIPPVPAALRETGASAITAPDNRWGRCDIKGISLLANVLLRQLSVDAAADETILLRDGFLTEGTASSIFAVSQGVLLAPPKSHLILPGITYDLVLELAAADGIEYRVQAVPEASLRSAEELWLCSSTKEVLAITRLDGKAVGDGAPGALFRRMDALYQDHKTTVMRQPTP